MVYHRIKVRIFAFFVIVIATALGALWYMRPLYLAYAENQAQQTASFAIYQAILEQVYENRADYAQLVVLERDDTNAVTALRTDGILSNYLRVQVEKYVFQALMVLEHETLTIPLGSLLLPEILGGFGPEVTFGMTALGDVTSTFTSAFYDAGINQTRHQVVLTVHCTVAVLTLFGAQTTPITVELPVTDTVIVGKVPDMYASLADTATGATVGDYAAIDWSEAQDLLGKIDAFYFSDFGAW